MGLAELPWPIGNDRLRVSALSGVKQQVQVLVSHVGSRLFVPSGQKEL